MKAAYHKTNPQPLATETDQARMQAILAKHAKIPTQGSGSVPCEAHNLEKQVQLLPLQPPLEWEPLLPGKRGYYDITHRYSCSSITIAGHEYFEASKLAGGGAWYYPLAQRLKSWAEAEARCQAEYLMDPP